MTQSTAARASQTSRPLRTLRMIPLGEPGPVLRPEQDYFSVAVVGLQLPGKALSTPRFMPVMWCSVSYHAPDGERTVAGLSPSSGSSRADGKADVQLTPRLIAREEMTVEFTLGAMRERDFSGGALAAAMETAATPAANFLSQSVPATSRDPSLPADRMGRLLDGLASSDKLQAIGRFAGVLRAPLASGAVVLTDAREEGRGFIYNEAGRQLTDPKGKPLRAAYAILRLTCEPARPDWMNLPDLRLAWARIREATLNGGDVLGAVEYFRITAVTSPDLTREHAQRVVEAVRQKLAPLVSGDEAAKVGDPGEMADALGFFLAGPRAPTQGEILRMGAEAAAAAAASVIKPGPFTRALTILLEREGEVAEPADDPSNMGVTQRTYDAYRKRKRLPMRTVKQLETGELQEIYHQGYWRAAMCHEMPTEALALLVFDAAANHGPRNALKLLQQAAGCPDAECDGLWRPETRIQVLAAASNPAGLAEQVLLRREALYRRIVDLNPKLGRFLRGWMNRLVVLRNHVRPLLVGAPAIGDSEVTLFEDNAERTPLIAADPDFTGIGPLPEPIDAVPSLAAE